MAGKQIPAGVARSRRFVRDGWMRVLSRAESDVWTVYNDAANNKGISFLGAGLIAERANIQEKNVWRYRKSLVRIGLLIVLEEGGGRGKPCKVQLVFPAASPPIPIPKTPSTNPLSGEEESTSETPSGEVVETPSQKTLNPLRTGSANKEEESLKNHMEEREAHSLGGDGGEGEGIASEGETLDREIREYVQGQQRMSMANLTPARMQPMRDLVRAVGWTRADRYVQRAISAGKSSPFDYALGIWRGELRDGKHQETETPKQRAARLAAEMAEEDRRTKARPA